uniref:Uncharacterized protein n=1 Tax=Spongospora subterranea TaxID=70186 RepID=A0A0H5QZJ3_9EUKA|eukprot:CRZ07131.1 hypothetical protein [Spongospora subterranea]
MRASSPRTKVWCPCCLRLVDPRTLKAHMQRMPEDDAVVVHGLENQHSNCMHEDGAIVEFGMGNEQGDDENSGMNDLSNDEDINADPGAEAVDSLDESGNASVNDTTKNSSKVSIISSVSDQADFDDNIASDGALPFGSFITQIDDQLKQAKYNLRNQEMAHFTDNMRLGMTDPQRKTYMVKIMEILRDMNSVVDEHGLHRVLWENFPMSWDDAKSGILSTLFNFQPLRLSACPSCGSTNKVPFLYMTISFVLQSLMASRAIAEKIWSGFHAIEKRIHVFTTTGEKPSEIDGWDTGDLFYEKYVPEHIERLAHIRTTHNSRGLVLCLGDIPLEFTVDIALFS